MLIIKINNTSSINELIAIKACRIDPDFVTPKTSLWNNTIKPIFNSIKNTMSGKDSCMSNSGNKKINNEVNMVQKKTRYLICF